MITSILRKVGLAAIMFLVFSCLKVGAQGYDMSDAQGNQNNTDYNRTGEGVQAMPVNLGANAVVPAGYTPLNLAISPKQSPELKIPLLVSTVKLGETVCRFAIWIVLFIKR